MSVSNEGSRYGLVLALTADKQYAAAVEHLAPLSAKYPDNPILSIAESRIAADNKQLQQAVNIITSALQKAPAPGKKLQKVGFLMLWVPEPTGVTCAIGGPMIVAGRYLEKKYNSATIGDVGSHTKNTFSSIRDFKNSVM